jgi:hypothetical protein
MFVERARKLGRIQHAREHLWRIGAPQHSTQHHRWRVPPVLASDVGVMMLGVVVGPPRLMGPLKLRPGARVGKGVVREPFLDREQGLRVICQGSPGSMRSLRIPNMS